MLNFLFKRKKNLNYLTLSLMKRGDIISMHDPKSIKDIITCYVENNNIEDKEIFIAISYKKETHTCSYHRVFKYSDFCLKHAHTLNSHKFQRESVNSNSVEEFLNAKIQEAIIDENYEIAEKLRKAIEIIK